MNSGNQEELTVAAPLVTPVWYGNRVG
jgi:hypothetical protein